MLGRIAVETAENARLKRSALLREDLYGISFLLGHVILLPGDGEAKKRRIFSRLFRSMAAAGVRRVVLPPCFPYGQALAAAGLSPFPVLGLYRAVAPQLALCGLREGGISPEQAAVALSAASMNRSLWESAFALSRKVRRLVVDVDGGGGEALRLALRRRCGLPVLTGALCPADFTLYYQPGAEATGPGFLLCRESERFPRRPRLYRSARLLPPPDLPPFPPDCAAEPLLAVLLESGRIRAEEIAAERLYEDAEPGALSVPPENPSFE